MFAQSSLLVIAAVVNILYFNVLAAHHPNAFEARVAVWGVTRWIAHIVAALAAQATTSLDGEVILAFHTPYSW